MKIANTRVYLAYRLIFKNFVELEKNDLSCLCHQSSVKLLDFCMLAVSELKLWNTENFIEVKDRKIFHRVEWDSYAIIDYCSKGQSKIL